MILKVARIGTDLVENREFEIEHLAEAIQNRSLNREDWVRENHNFQLLKSSLFCKK